MLFRGNRQEKCNKTKVKYYENFVLRCHAGLFTSFDLKSYFLDFFFFDSVCIYQECFIGEIPVNR